MINKNHNDEDIIGFTDNSLETIDAEKPEKDNGLNNNIGIVHKKKTDTLPNIELRN